jgi:hypothetical protein
MEMKQFEALNSNLDKKIISSTPSWSSPSLRDLLSHLNFSEPKYSSSYKSKEVSTFWRREAVASKKFIDIYNKNVNQWRTEFSRHNITFSNDGRVCWDNSTKIFPSIDEIELYYKDPEEGVDLFLDHTGIDTCKFNEKLLNIINCKSSPFNFDFRISKIISENSCVLTGHVKHGYIEIGDSAFVLFNSQFINVKILDAVNVGVQIKKIYGGLFPEILVEHEIGHFPDRGVLMDKIALSEAPKWIEFSRRHKLAMESINHRNRQILYLKKELRRNLNLLINHGSPREFEVLVAELFEKMGGKCTLTPPSRDGGKDIIVELTNIKYYIECKLFSRENKVGRPLIQKLAGVIATEKTKGLFVTTSSYTEGAIEYAAKAGIELWNFNKLAELIAEFYPNQNCNFPYTAICLECGALTEFNLLENKTSSICSSGHEVAKTISLEECCL